MQINYPDVVAVAKSVTELAIQHNFITVDASMEDTAKKLQNSTAHFVAN